MHDPDFSNQRRAMISAQLARRGIRAPEVLGAMGRVPRELFVPFDRRNEAYEDHALEIGCDQTISQPYIVALMTEALQLRGDERLLEIGTGSGYQAAVLAELAGDVVSIERHADLSRAAARVLADLGYRNVRLIVGDGTHGFAEQAPYDGIMVTAAADQVPRALLEQLAEDGRLIVPVGPAREGQVLQVVRRVQGRFEMRELTSCRFVPLIAETP